MSPTVEARALRRSIATVSLSGTLEEKLHAASLAGFDGIELFEADLLGCPWPPGEVRARCQDLGLRIELYQPVRDLEGLPRERHEAAVARARAKLALSAALDAPVMLVCSSVASDAIDDDDLAAEDLHEIGVLAAEHGVHVAYEALSWGRWVNTYRRSWRIVKAAGHASVGICLDSFHVLSIGDRIDEVAEIDSEKLFFLQLADAPYVAMDLLQWSRHHRCFPGQGSFDLVAFTARVLGAGYEGPLSLEIFNDVIRRADANMTAVDGMRSLLALEDGLSRDQRGGLSQAQRARLRVLPFASPPSRIVAAGLRGDASLAVGLEAMLGPMGFASERGRGEPTERSWRCGEVELSVRRDPSAAPHGERVIGELSLSCPDPRGSASRARALLAAVRQQDDAPIAEIVAPDRRVIKVVPDETGDAQGSRPPISAVDHVVLTLDDDEFDEAMLFYRAVLFLEAQPGEELASPDGLLRSRALATPQRGTPGCAGIRIALNAALYRGHHAQLAEREHIAFACDDVFAVARAWRAAGVPLLDIPDNYYEDLRARLGVDGDLLTMLRDLKVLYDRDDNGRELFHCYTEAVGSRFFFELVQRAAGYDGYGASNAMVRMSAQRWRARAAAVR